MSFAGNIAVLFFQALTVVLKLILTQCLASSRIRFVKRWLSAVSKGFCDAYYPGHAPGTYEFKYFNTISAMPHYDDSNTFESDSFSRTPDREYYFMDDIPVMVEIPKRKNQSDTGRPLLQLEDDNDEQPLHILPVTPVRYREIHHPDSDSTYLRNSASTKYTPHYYDPKYLTPIRHSRRDGEVTFTLLKAASDRVSDILRENRRRLDAGEDPCAVRRELRRRRAQELSARRKNRSPYA